MTKTKKWNDHIFTYSQVDRGMEKLSQTATWKCDRCGSTVLEGNIHTCTPANETTEFHRDICNKLTVRSVRTVETISKHKS